MAAPIQEMIMGACDLPAVPDVAHKVMKLLADPNSTSSMICKAISADQALTARILKISNSAFYGCLRTINNLQSAIVIIGYTAIRSLVIAVSSREVYKRFGLTEQMMWEHSVGVGVASHILAQEVKLSKVDDVFVCGLLHDLGKVVMNNADPERYKQVMETVYNENVEPIEAEREIFGFTHTEVGALVVKKWNLTEELEKVVRFHHDINQLSDQDEYVFILASLLNLADRICRRLGIGSRGADESIEVKGTTTAKTIGLADDRMDEVVAKIEQVYSEERNIFN